MKRNSIARQTSFMTMASIGQKIIAFVYFTFIARTIGADGTGQYFFALSFTTIFVVFIDLGFTNVLIREAARVKEDIQSYLSTLLSFKLVLAVCTYIACVATVHVFNHPVELRHMVYLSAVTMIFDSFHLTFYGVLRALGQLKWEAISIVGSQLLTLLLGTYFLSAGYPLIFLIAAFTVPSALNLFFVIAVLVKKYNVYPKIAFNKEIFFHLGRIAVPFALAAVFARIYSYIDSVILSAILGTTAVGYYAIPYKITFAFQFIPLALVAALYPRFSEYYTHSKEKLFDLLFGGLRYLWILACPIAFGIAALSQDIILLLYGPDFMPSVFPLRILILGIIFSFVSFPIGAFLNACDRQKTQTAIIGLVMVVNIMLNILLIPRIGVIGAALSATIGNMLLTILGYSIIPKIIKIPHKAILSLFIRIIIAAAVMGYIVFTLSSIVLPVRILIGAFVYPLLLFLFKVVGKEDIHIARMLLSRK